MVTPMLQVDLKSLRALSGAEAEAALEKLASLRSVLLGLPIRCCISPFLRSISYDCLQASGCVRVFGARLYYYVGA